MRPTDDVTGMDLGLATVVKMSQAISEEIILSKLIGRLITIAVECAGAERGLLILLDGEMPRIEAEAVIRDGRVTVIPREEAVTSDELPMTVFQCTMRTRESMILDDAATSRVCAEDDYVGQKRPRSVLCLPIVKQTRFIGALYLENNLAPHVFNAGRVSVLNLLASQAAISLENARIHAKLRRSEELMAEGQRVARTGSWLWNLQTRKLTWSEGQKQIFGFSSDRELTFEDYVGTLHPEDREVVLKTLSDASSAGLPYDQEFRIVLPDGAIRFIYSSGRPVLDESGGTMEYLGATADVTERKKAEDDLRRSAVVVEQTQRAARTASLWWKPSTNEVRWSKQNYRLLQYPESMIPSVELIMARIHPDDRDFVAETVGRAAREACDVDFKNRHLMPDGSIVYVHVILKKFDTDSGELEFVGAVTDITEQHKVETDLEVALASATESKNELGTIIDTIPALAWVANKDGAAEYLNKRWLDFTGLSVEKAIGAGWVTAIHPEDIEMLSYRWNEIRVSAKPGEIEARMKRFDGEYRWYLFRAAPLLDWSGKIVKWYGTNVDIDGFKRAEQALRESEAHLRKIQAELAHVARTTTMGELAASIAHEVSQPLTGVVTNANASLRWLAADTPNLNEARRSIKRLIRDGTRAGEVLTGIRKLFRKETQKMERLDINALIREVMVLTRSELHSNDITLQLHLASDVPPALGDRVQIQQVLMNLILNAIDAMSPTEGGSRVLSISTLGDDGDCVRVKVQDTGPGIATEDIERVFKPFQTSKTGGMGMGLSICRTIVEDHGGQLSIVPHDGSGAWFEFTLQRQS